MLFGAKLPCSTLKDHSLLRHLASLVLQVLATCYDPDAPFHYCQTIKPFSWRMDYCYFAESSSGPYCFACWGRETSWPPEYCYRVTIRILWRLYPSELSDWLTWTRALYSIRHSCLSLTTDSTLWQLTWYSRQDGKSFPHWSKALGRHLSWSFYDLGYEQAPVPDLVDASIALKLFSGATNWLPASSYII